MQALTVKTAQEEWEDVAAAIWKGLAGQEEGWLELEGPVWDGDKLASFGVGSANRLRLIANVGKAMRAVGVWPGSVLAADDNTWFGLHHAFKMVRDAMIQLNGGPLMGFAKPMSRTQCVDAWKAAEADVTGEMCGSRPVNGIRVLGADGTVDGVGAFTIVDRTTTWLGMSKLPEYFLGLLIGQWQVREGREMYTRAWAYNWPIELAPEATSLADVADSDAYKSATTISRDLSIRLEAEELMAPRAEMEKEFTTIVAPQAAAPAKTETKSPAKSGKKTPARAGGKPAKRRAAKEAAEKVAAAVRVMDVPEETIDEDTEVDEVEEEVHAGNDRSGEEAKAPDKAPAGPANTVPPGWGEPDRRPLPVAVMDFECAASVSGGHRYPVEGAIVVMDVRNGGVLGHSVGLFAEDLPVSVINTARAASEITGLPPLTFVDISKGTAPKDHEKAFPAVEDWLELVYTALVAMERKMGKRIPILAKGVQMERDILVRGGRTRGACKAFFAERLRDEQDAAAFNEMEIRDERRWQRGCDEREMLSWMSDWQERSETKRWCPYHRLAHPGHHCALGDCVLETARIRAMVGHGTVDGRLRQIVETTRVTMAMEKEDWEEKDLLVDNMRSFLPAAQVMTLFQAPVPAKDAGILNPSKLTVANTTKFRFGAADGALAVIEGTKGILLNRVGAGMWNGPIWDLERGLRRMFTSLVVNEQTLTDPETAVAPETKGRVPLVSHVQRVWPANRLVANYQDHEEWKTSIPRSAVPAFLRVCANSKAGGGQAWAFIPREWGIRRLGSNGQRDMEKAWHRRLNDCEEPESPRGIIIGPFPGAARRDTGLNSQWGTRIDAQSTRVALQNNMRAAADWWVNCGAGRPSQNPRSSGPAGPSQRMDSSAPPVQRPTATRGGHQLNTPLEEQAGRSEGDIPAGWAGLPRGANKEEDSLLNHPQGKRARLAELEAVHAVVKTLEERGRRDREAIEKMEVQLRAHAEAAAAMKAGIDTLVAAQAASKAGGETVGVLRASLEDARREMADLRAQARMQQWPPMTMAPQAGMFGVGPAQFGALMGQQVQGQTGAPQMQGAMLYGQSQPLPSTSHPGGVVGQQDGRGTGGQMRTPPASGRGEEQWRGDGQQGAQGTGQRWA